VRSLYVFIVSSANNGWSDNEKDAPIMENWETSVSGWWRRRTSENDNGNIMSMFLVTILGLVSHYLQLICWQHVARVRHCIMNLLI
jgi:hypothetical protein